MTEQTASKVPQIRFKGFDGKWEPRELGEITTKIGSGKTPRGGKTGYLSIGIPLIRSQNIFNDSVNCEGVAFISDETDAEMSNSWVFQNDVLLNITGASIGRSAVYRSGERANVNQHVCIIRANGNHHSDFIQLNLSSTRGQAAIDNSQAGGAREGLNFQQIAKFGFQFPSHTEQTKIGEYFRELDSLIGLHQRKHDKLVTLKKAMLQKMFPRSGTTLPEVRFKGFKGEWGERSWVETVDVSTDMVDPRNRAYDELFHIGPGNIESFTGKIYNNVLKVKDSHLISGKFRFNKGDIIYGKINPQLAKYIVAPFEGLASADAYVLNAKNGVVQNYLYVMLQTEDFYKYSVSVSARTGMPKINRDELNVYSYKAPDESEQTKIGTYFRTLDELISQHATQLQKLQQLKSACLARMFV